MSNQNEDKISHQIGSTVRFVSSILIQPAVYAKIQKKKTVNISRRGMIATLSDDDEGCGKCTIIVEEIAPTPLVGNFLIAPVLIDNQRKEEVELEIPLSDTQPLLPFEELPSIEFGDDVGRYKEYGDELFKLHDYSRAISYYEAALSLTSSNCNNIGGTLVVKRNGRCVVAELDCIDTDGEDSQCDVTFILPNGIMEEDVISSKDIILSVWNQDGVRRGKRVKSRETFMQPRILLNLCRCLLNLSEVDIDNADMNTSSTHDRRTKYKKAAVLGSSIAITLCEYYKNETDSESQLLTNLQEKAKIIRSKAFMELGKLPNALVDVKKIMNENPGNREVAELLRDIRMLEQYKKKADKKLSKEVCRWVQTATGDL